MSIRRYKEVQRGMSGAEGRFVLFSVSQLFSKDYDKSGYDHKETCRIPIHRARGEGHGTCRTILREEEVGHPPGCSPVVGCARPAAPRVGIVGTDVGWTDGYI
jgi:hypothetical protein